MSFKLELRELEQLTQQLSTTNLRFPSCDKDIEGGGKGRKGGAAVVQWEVAGRRRGCPATCLRLRAPLSRERLSPPLVLEPKWR